MIQLLSPSEAMQQAEQHMAAGQIVEAEAILRQILSTDPNYHLAYHTLGLIAYEVGKLPLAVELINTAITIDKGIALYHRNLGEMCRRLGRLDEAVVAGKRACKLTPKDLDAHYNLGLAFTDKSEWGSAIRSYKRALKLNPTHGLSWNNLGAALEKQGNIAEAKAAYAKAVKLNPAHSEAQNNLGAIYSENGKLDEARQCFEEAIKSNPDFIEAHFNLSSLKTYRNDDPHLLHLERNFAKANEMQEKTRIRYWFALGKAREDVGRYDDAFTAYESGNRLQHSLLPCDETHADEMMERVMAIFDRDFFEARKHIQGSDKTPIFIVGMPRSGTTLLEQILSSHPAVYGAGELSDLNEIIVSAERHAGKRFPDFAPDLTAEDFVRLGVAYVKRLWKLAPGLQCITDKMPANFFYIGMIRLMLPNAKIIHAMRDPMDSCFSNYARLFSDTMEFAYDLGTLGRYYVRYIKLMRHWHNVLPKGAILDLHYEDMVANTEGQARRIFDYVGLPWDDNCLAFHQNKRHVKTASVAQVRKPIYKTSVARWQRFEKHLTPLLKLVQDYRDNDAPATSLSDQGARAQEKGKAQVKSIQVDATGTTGEHSPLEQTMAMANQLQSQGRLQEAENLLRQILQVQPHHAFALHLLGVIAYQAVQPELAIELIQQAIQNDGNVALFHTNIGEMFRQQGRFDMAVKHGERAIELDPDQFSAHSNLGIAYFDLKDYERAADCQHHALEIDPNFAPALNSMGSICRANKDKNAAMDWYRRAIASSPSYPEPLSNLGAVLLEEERAEEALIPLEQAVRINPNYTEALCNLGMAYNMLDRYDAAIPLLQKALSLRPGYAEAYVGLARAYLEKENFPEAEQYARNAVEMAPEKADVYILLGNIYKEIALGSEAEAMYHRALEIEPECNDALLGLGHLSMEEGDMDMAEKLFLQALSNDANCIAARFHLSQVKKMEVGDENFTALEAIEIAARNTEYSLSVKQAMTLHFALGKCYDDSKQYEKAFPHFLKGWQLKRTTFNYDANETTQRFNAIMQVFDKSMLERLCNGGDNSHAPIFILGMPRSGTTLTEQIIASHPEVYGAGELPDLLSIANRVVLENIYPQNMQALDQMQLTAWGADYVAGLQKRAPHARHITDKMPANFYVLGLIHLMLPNAKIIHVNRNPVDTCLSCLTRLFNRKQDQTYDLTELGRYYIDYVRLMEHWRKILPAGAFLDVQYENIVTDQETQARRMLEYCELEWNDACLDFHKNKRVVRTASVTQVRQPIYTSSVEKWRHYEKFLGPLLDELGDLVPK